MGSGIAQVLAQAGHEVLLKGRSEASLAKAHKAMEKNLSRMVEKGKMEAAVKEQALSRVKDTLNYEDCAGVELVIEAIAEDMATKVEVFKLLDGICPAETILATNTSSLSITEVAAATNRPDKVIGMHFFNPVPAMKLVELIKGQLTSAEVHDKIFALVQEVGKVPVTVNEAPGFVVNRILIPLVNEGIGILADGIATKEEIDTAMKLGANHPMGPLELGDLIGLDVCLAIMEVLYHEFGDSKYRPHPLLRKMVRANLLGRKTGIGKSIAHAGRHAFAGFQRSHHVVGVIGCTEAHDLGVNLRTAGLSVFKSFQHEHAGAFTHDETAAAGVEGTGSLFGLVLMSRAERFHGCKSGNAHFRDGGFGAAGDDGIGAAEHKLIIGAADGVQRGGAGARGNDVDTLRTRENGHLAGSHVGNQHGNVEGRNAVGAGSTQLFVEIFNGLEPAETDAQHHAHATGVALVDLETGMLHKLHTRADGQLTEAVHLAALLGRDEFFGGKILHFARDMRGKFGGIKLGDTADAGLAGKKGLPAALQVGSQRRDG